jgi:hypothetical protein
LSGSNTALQEEATDLTDHVNTFDDSFADEYRRDHSYEYFRSPVIVSTLTRVLKEVRAPRDIAFMTMDCEGQDVKIINELWQNIGLGFCALKQMTTL